ncbi:hypothetical protein MKX01_019917, partial [Papaver californicum]
MLQWLTGSPFFPPFTIISTFRCLHTSNPNDPYSPDLIRESDDLKTLLLKGFEFVGALIVTVGDSNWEENSSKAIGIVRKFISLPTSSSSGLNIQMEPPSNQSFYNNYAASQMWPEEDK